MNPTLRTTLGTRATVALCLVLAWGIGRYREQRIEPEEKLVVVTTGGGGDGYAHMDAYLRMLEEWGGPPPFRTVMVTGPFMPKKMRVEIFNRSRSLAVRSYRFYRRMERLMGAADVVVSMGGYNTVCQILS